GDPDALGGRAARQAGPGVSPRPLAADLGAPVAARLLGHPLRGGAPWLAGPPSPHRRLLRGPAAGQGPGLTRPGRGSAGIAYETGHQLGGLDVAESLLTDERTPRLEGERVSDRRSHPYPRLTSVASALHQHVPGGVHVAVEGSESAPHVLVGRLVADQVGHHPLRAPPEP